ncbi:hypothetical protein DPMN_063599 [Dreissena polymorpha]|uniref:Uncharacterized protein n=1 Tax=Dreissena polymorpha TaxID=45954 RepID=A0A9D4HIR2_DREPO|nr:hypothetical protein DPMN_063599 [Dreissena polymorpha]
MNDIEMSSGDLLFEDSRYKHTKLDIFRVSGVSGSNAHEKYQAKGENKSQKEKSWDIELTSTYREYRDIRWVYSVGRGFLGVMGVVVIWFGSIVVCQVKICSRNWNGSGTVLEHQEQF